MKDLTYSLTYFLITSLFVIFSSAFGQDSPAIMDYERKEVFQADPLTALLLTQYPMNKSDLKKFEK